MKNRIKYYTLAVFILAMPLFVKGQMKGVKQIMTGGAYSLKARSVLLSSSAVNWASMLMGTSPIFYGYTKLTQELASEKNRIQKILEDANIKLSSVVSNNSGGVATKIITGLMEGWTDLEALIGAHYHKKHHTLD